MLSEDAVQGLPRQSANFQHITTDDTHVRVGDNGKDLPRHRQLNAITV